LGGKLNPFFLGIPEQTEQTFRRIEVLLRAAGISLYDVISRLVYPRQFLTETKPVRTTVRADLVADMRVEVTAIAYRVM
jgi:enamine deaminase RidA (YjgF/YER057c/UK114 family)